MYRYITYKDIRQLDTESRDTTDTSPSCFTKYHECVNLAQTFSF